MTNWDKYSQTKAQTSDLTGSRPSVWEYLIIRVVDNGLIVTIVSLTVALCAAGLVLQLKKLDGATWFFDLAKIAFGVLLGLIADKKPKR